MIKKIILGCLVSMNVAAAGTIVADNLDEDILTESEVAEICSSQSSDSIKYDEMNYSCISEDEEVAVFEDVNTNIIDTTNIDEEEKKDDDKAEVKEEQTSVDSSDNMYLYMPIETENSAQRVATGVNKDNDEPVIDLNSDIVTIYKGDNFDASTYIASASDDTDGDLTSEVEISSSVDENKAGTYTIKYSVKDSSGNVAVKRLIVIVEDITIEEPPVITLTNINIDIIEKEDFDPYNYLVFARDGLGNDITDDVEISSDVDVTVRGTYFVTYEVSDKDGNYSSLVLNVNVVKAPDVTVPVISLSEEKVIITTDDIFNPYDYLESAIDDEDGDLLDFVEVSDEEGYYEEGIYEIIYSLKDNSGNYTQQVLTLVVTLPADITPPVITLNDKEVTVDFGETYDYNSNLVSAIDSKDGDITQNVEIWNDVDFSTPGSYQVGYYVSDAAGNKASEWLVINVNEPKDTQAPVIDLTDNNIEILVGSFIDPIIYLESAIDNKDGDLTSQVEIFGTINFNEIGQYELTYLVTDAAGNTAKEILTINIITTNIDETAPIIHLTHSEISLIQGSTIYPLMYLNSAIDETDGNITNLVEVSGEVDSDNPGTYELIYTVQDSSGNMTEETLVVYIVAK